MAERNLGLAGKAINQGLVFSVESETRPQLAERAKEGGIVKKAAIFAHPIILAMEAAVLYYKIKDRVETFISGPPDAVTVSRRLNGLDRPI